MSRRRGLRAAALGGVLGLAVGCATGLGQGPETRLVFFTDVHAKPAGDVPNLLVQAARAINEASPDVVIAGGDLIAGPFLQAGAAADPGWDAYLDFLRRIDAPAHHVLGNHDLVGGEPDPRAPFRTRLGVKRSYGSFDAGGHHFVLLDSVHILEGVHYEGRVGREQLDWLEADLSRVPADRPIVLALHLPLRTAHFGRDPAPPDRVVVNADEVLGLFASHRLVLVLQGHLHVREQLREGATTFLTGGAVSGDWWRGVSQDTPPGFYVIELRGGRVDARYTPY